MRGRTDQAQPSEHLERLLRDGEEVAWYAKPGKKALYVSNAVGALFLGVFFGVFFGAPGSMFVGGFAAVVWGEQAAVWGVVGFLGLLAVGIPAGIMVGIRRQYHNAEYVVTGDRVIKTDGMVGRDTSSVSLADVQDVNVNVGPIAKLFGTGSLEFQTAGGSDSGVTLHHVPSPYVTLQTIQEPRQDAEQRTQTAGTSRQARA